MFSVQKRHLSRTDESARIGDCSLIMAPFDFRSTAHAAVQYDFTEILKHISSLKLLFVA